MLRQNNNDILNKESFNEDEDEERKSDEDIKIGVNYEELIE